MQNYNEDFKKNKDYLLCIDNISCNLAEHFLTNLSIERFKN
jgi:hypothetical protein